MNNLLLVSLLIFLGFSVVLVSAQTCQSPCLTNASCQNWCGSQDWFCEKEGKTTGICEEIIPPAGGGEVPEFTTIGIGAAIVLGGAAYLMLKNRKP